MDTGLASIQIAMLHADAAAEKVAEQEHDKMHSVIMRKLLVEILAAEICLGDLLSIEWFHHALLDLVELILNLMWLWHVIAFSSMGRLSLDNVSNAPQAVSHHGQLLRKGEIEASSVTPEKTA